MEGIMTILNYKRSKHKEIAELCNCKEIVMFGAGPGSTAVYLDNVYLLKGRVVAFCDNNKRKQKVKHIGMKVFSVSECVKKYPEAMYVVSFKNNKEEKFKTVQKQLKEYGVCDSNITNIYVNIEKRCLPYKVDNYLFAARHIWGLYKRTVRQEKVTAIVTLTWGKYAPLGGVGGPRAAVSCAKCLLGEAFGDVELKYYFQELNKYSLIDEQSLISDNPYREWLERIQAVDDIVDLYDATKTIYVVHEPIAAFALAARGQTYHLCWHAQGSIVDDRKNMGKFDSGKEKQICQYMEKIAFERASSIHFASNGASECFMKSTTTLVKLDKFNIDISLPVTVWGNCSESIEPVGLVVGEKELTILSIGQMTYAKGMDRIPGFIEKILEKGQKVHWIVVAKGAIKEMVLEECSKLAIRYHSFRYTQFDRCNYKEINGLHKVADVYLMLHRVSIFDISTLEAMQYGKVVVLSPVGGNLDFDKIENIIFCWENAYNECVEKLLQINFEEVGKKNRQVFERYFSPDAYIERYRGVYKSWLKTDDYQ